MPELPEVYTTVTGLQKNIVGLKIIDVWSGVFSDHKLFRNTIKNKKYFTSFKKNVIDVKVISVSQNAKNILINLNNGFTIVIHMKMTGHLLYGSWIKDEGLWKPVDKNSALNDRYNRHIRFMFTFSNNKRLAFCDSRKFGTIEIFETKEIESGFKNIATSPLDENFSEKEVRGKLLKSTREIKTLLMDQKIIGGIGNIYSDEMLFKAHVLPTRKSKSLSDSEWKLLFKNMKEVLKKGIEFGGDSMSDYRNIFGEKGNYQNAHLVYGRVGQKCLTKNCKGTIKKKKIGGRSASYCDVCQK